MSLMFFSYITVLQKYNLSPKSGNDENHGKAEIVFKATKKLWNVF